MSFSESLMIRFPQKQKEVKQLEHVFENFPLMLWKVLAVRPLIETHVVWSHQKKVCWMKA